jgi:hypothetical protein
MLCMRLACSMIRALLSSVSLYVRHIFMARAISSKLILCSISAVILGDFDASAPAFPSSFEASSARSSRLLACVLLLPRFQGVGVRRVLVGDSC